jgi:hypothetical protein
VGSMSKAAPHDIDVAAMYKEVCHDDQEKVGEVIVLGSVPCAISSELHVNGQRVARRETGNAPSVKGEPERKHIQRWTTKRREIVGPGYSTCGRNMTENDWHSAWQTKGRVGPSHAQPVTQKWARGKQYPGLRR